MINLGKIKIGKTMYSFFSGCRDAKTGQFAKTGKRYFEFAKMKKNSEGLYEIVKHENMSSFGVGAGRTVSEALYYAQTPAGKAGLFGLGAIAAGVGAWGLYKYIDKDNSTDSKTTNDNTVTKNKTKKQVTNITSQPTEEYDSLYVIQKNDNIWNINKGRLKKKGDTTTNSRISGLTNETVKINPTKTKNNGDLIFPGDTLVMPRLDCEV